MNKRFLIFSIISFMITLPVLFFVVARFEPKDTESIPQDIIKYVQNKVSLGPNCDYEESIEYFTYIDSDWDKNNKVGLYIYAENESYFEIAQQLVNSNGGDWGYVTIPYNVKDKDHEKWERVFRQLRNKHLIPIVQLWDINLDKHEEQTEEAAEFLNRFVWPVKERYISAYNEMNSANFWYGEINPEQYARTLDYTIHAFKEVNSEFFIINGALNISAPTNKDHMDAFVFMSKMEHEVPGIFEKLDGWASHPYPQPNFSGNPHASGRWSVRAYENELNFLKHSIGVKKELPVFITETGWAHAQGKDYNGSFVDAELAAEYFRIAYEEIWLLDDRVRAVTPFTIRYEAPFDHFSWINEDGVPYIQYDKVKSIDKIGGNPPRFELNKQKVSGCDY